CAHPDSRTGHWRDAVVRGRADAISVSGSFLTELSKALLQDRPIPPARLRITDALAAFLVGLNTDEGKMLARLHGAHPDAFADVPAVAAITRLSECDDIELASCVTPGSIVIPVALA